MMSPNKYSHVAAAAIQELEKNHQEYHEKLWAKTNGRIVGEIQHTPRGTWKEASDPPEGHSNWLPEKMSELIARTEVYCDFMTLSPPTIVEDDYFFKKIKEALATLANKSIEFSGKKIVVRFLFGNIVSQPTNCDELMTYLTEGLPESSNLEVWVGAWRRGACWNHAKLIAVDGKYLHTGGHNCWAPAYLEKSPVHDTSIELEGEVAIQGHLYANAQWEFIKQRQSSLKGWLISKYNDGWLTPTITRVTVSEWPKTANTFPPLFKKETLPSLAKRSSDDVNIISLGRYGKIGGKDARSSDDAFIAMFNASKKSIRFFLQDLGPVNMAGISYKGWPKNYFETWSKAMYERDVDVEIVLSNPGSKGGVDSYSNGWSAEIVAAEIIKTMKSQYPNASDDELEAKVKKNLRICFLRMKCGNSWENGDKVGLHSKFFIIDDISTYIGSQNLYQFDLAEWGILIDDEKKTADMKESLWNPMWSFSYPKDASLDINPGKVLELLGVNRDPPDGEKGDDEPEGYCNAMCNVM
mmetsp:Transcript_6678/g.9831  ORF Transcript_6678/g.9831 Transcript_6678/m.9831 type:complete len:524 (-) Transcript_6678:146-1717(-)